MERANQNTDYYVNTNSFVNTNLNTNPNTIKNKFKNVNSNNNNNFNNKNSNKNDIYHAGEPYYCINVNDRSKLIMYPIDENENENLKEITMLMRKILEEQS